MNIGYLLRGDLLRVSPVRWAVYGGVICCSVGMWLMGDTIINAGGGANGKTVSGNGAGTLDYGSIVCNGASSYTNNTTTGFSNGGGVFAGSLVQQGPGIFSGNVAASGHGGGLYSRGNITVASGSSFRGNAASGNGGAICLDSNDGETLRTIVIGSGASFIENTAGGLGGAIFVAGKSAVAKTVLNFVSQDSASPISFSGNMRGRVPGSSTGGERNAITVMSHVDIVVHADANCMVNLEDPVDSFPGYSSSCSLVKKGEGKLSFAGGISKCHFPILLEQGSLTLAEDASVSGISSLVVEQDAHLDITLARTPQSTPKISAQGAIVMDDGADIVVRFPALQPSDKRMVWPLMEGTILPNPDVSYDPVSSSEWEGAGTLFISRSMQQGKSLVLLNWERTPTPYEQWKKKHFVDGTPEDDMASDACPAGDGITNLMKYATGLDPLKPCGSVTLLSGRKGEAEQMHLVLSWPVNPDATDVKHEVEFSTDLKNWILLQEVDTAGKTKAEFVDPEPIGANGTARKFLRLKVTRE